MSELNDYEERISKLEKQKEQEKQRAKQLLQDKISAVKMMLEMNISPELIKEKMNIDDDFLDKHFSK